MLLLFCDHSSKLGQKLGVVVVVNKLEVVVRKRATTTAHLSGRLTAECGHALVVDREIEAFCNVICGTMQMPMDSEERPPLQPSVSK